MKRLRPGLAGALAGLLALAALLGLTSRAPAQPGVVPFGQGTHAFRRILHDLKLEPLKSVADLDDPAHTLLIALGDTDVLDEVPGGLRGFLHNGGAVLLATDRETPSKHLQADFGFRVTGTSLRVLNDRWAAEAYHDIPECPLVTGFYGAKPDLLGELPALQGFRLRRVATNRPSCLEGRPTVPGLSVLATLPPGCAAEGMAGRTDPGLFLGRRFAIGGVVDRGRLLVLADHSIFINDMMLQPDTDNIDFTYNCIEWLTQGAEPRTRVLFVEEGEVNSAFDIPLKQVDVPLPPEEALVPMANQVLTEVEQEDIFNKLLLDVVPFPALVAVLMLALTALLAVYGLHRLIRSRHRVDLWAPLLERVLAKQKPAGSLLEQRHQAMLGQGNLWEPARALVRAAFAEAGVGTDADGEPAIHMAGDWWQRWVLGRRALHLWRIAHGRRPVRVSPGQFARLVRELEQVQAALAAGTLRLEFSRSVATGGPPVAWGGATGGPPVATGSGAEGQRGRNAGMSVGLDRAADIRELAERVRTLRDQTVAEVGRVVVGMDGVTHQFLIALLAAGHVLLEGVPGVAKTTLSKTFARVLGIEYQRIQFTPDLLPSDVTGTYVFDRRQNEFALRRGPIFAQVLLADEVNRAPAKTQSALLEAMQENQVTIEGTTLPLPRPFMVLATQNPVEQEGVYRLPEAQLDRFLLRVEMGYPAHDAEVAMLGLHSGAVAEPSPLFTPESILEVQGQLARVHGTEGLMHYIVDLAEASRQHPDLALGASPRASLCLLRCARARALLDGRHYFTHEDVHAVALPVLGHRLIVRPEAEVEGRRVADVIRDLLDAVPVLETK